MIFVIFRLTKYFNIMNLTERLNVLIQAATLSQKNGVLTLDEAVKAKSAIDIITSGTLNQNFTSAINALIEIAISSQKKGAYTLKDAYMLYIAIEGIEKEFQNEVNKINGIQVESNNNHIVNMNQQEDQNIGSETTISIPPKKLKKKS